jgi:hypothetical protein
MTRRAAAAALLVLALAAASPRGALADGDPASDVLLGQAVFLGYGSVSHAAAARLYAVTAAAAARGYPVRVAVIGARTDLGTVPVLFGKPVQYARFLSAEVPGTNPILVVMPAGFGLARGGGSSSIAPLAGLGTGSGAPTALAAAAVDAVERLSAANGRPLPAGAASASAGPGAGASTVRHAVIAIGVMGLLAAVGVATAWRARGRAADLG